MQSSMLNVMLVEDSSDDVLLMEQLIERSGLPVEMKVMSDGELALSYLQAKSETCKASEVAQVIFLDLALPGVGGIEILRRLKEDPKLHDIPVIILSSTEKDGDIKDGQDLKAHTHITKPMSVYEFTWIARSVNGYWRRIEKIGTMNPPNSSKLRRLIRS